MKASELIGQRVVDCMTEVRGTIVEAKDPPAGSFGVGIDCLIRWEDGTKSWLDASDVCYENEDFE